MFILYGNKLTTISDENKPDIIETEITMPYIINYIVEVLLHFTKFRPDGTLNLREYLDDIYVKIVDIWGFITVYYPFLEMLSNNYFKLNDNELKIFKQLQHIFNEYLYTPRSTPINMNQLYGDLKTLGNLINIIAHEERKTKSSEHSLAAGIKTRKNSRISRSVIFNRKKLAKRFKKPFFLSLK
jgi:hypothetical protein